MPKKFIPCCVVVMVCVALLPWQAKGDTFSFTISGDGIESSGILTTKPESDGSYIVTSISGSLDGSPIELLSAGSFKGNDNLLLAGTPEFDGSGISFSADGTKYSLTYLGPKSSYFLSGGTDSSDGRKVTFKDPSVDWGSGGDEGDNGDDGEKCEDHKEGDDEGGCKKAVTPEPPSILFVLSGLGLCLWTIGGALRRRTADQILSR
jgi:hypothetical protein